MVGTHKNGNAPLCSIGYGEFPQLDEELLVFQGLCYMELPRKKLCPTLCHLSEDLGFVLTRNIVFIKFVFKLIIISLYDYL